MHSPLGIKCSARVSGEIVSVRRSHSSSGHVTSILSLNLAGKANMLRPRGTDFTAKFSGEIESVQTSRGVT